MIHDLHSLRPWNASQAITSSLLHWFIFQVWHKNKLQNRIHPIIKWRFSIFFRSQTDLETLKKILIEYVNTVYVISSYKLILSKPPAYSSPPTNQNKKGTSTISRCIACRRGWLFISRIQEGNSSGSASSQSNLSSSESSWLSSCGSPRPTLMHLNDLRELRMRKLLKNMFKRKMWSNQVFGEINESMYHNVFPLAFEFQMKFGVAHWRSAIENCAQENVSHLQVHSVEWLQPSMTRPGLKKTT